MESNQKELVEVDCTRVPYADTAYFGKIVLDYLADAEPLRPFYHRRPEIENFRDQITEKSQSYQNRAVLAEAVRDQYAGAKLKSPGIDLLAEEHTYTITTGHQLCLFTGPLYFFYKIVSAINTTKLLADKYPDFRFVPVFWMASEDHDFEEANHFYLPSGKIAWETDQTGAVGRMKIENFAQIESMFREALGVGYRSGELIDLFRKSYQGDRTLAEATRHLVHTLFGHLGVVVIDGDDPQLKALAKDAFRTELTQGLSAKAMEATNESLLQHYSLQVNARPINLFYLDDQLRERIVKAEDGHYEVVNNQLRFTEQEILNMLESNPEKFSPNVVLRGLYQEIILPNLAYIGGGGELAYWFQLKDVFKGFHVPFPILMLRNSALVVRAEARFQLEALQLEVSDLFQPVIDLENSLVKAASDQLLDLEKSRKKLQDLFQEIEARMGLVDPILKRPAQSGSARVERIVSNLEKKMLRAERQKQEVILSRLQKVREALFPREGLQERNMNFAPMYQAFGKEFIPLLCGHLEPFDFRFSVLVEKVAKSE